MWLWGEQWEEKEKKKKKSRGHSTLDLVHLPMPATRPLDFHSNRVGHRAGRGMTTTIGKPREFPIPSFSVQRWISPLSFLFFFFFANRKNAKKGKKEKRVEAYFRATRSWNRGIASFLVTSYIFSLENREGMVRVATLETPLPLSLPLPLSRGIYEREKVSRSCNVSRASSMESRFLKGSGMGETREIFNRNRLDP